MKKIFYTLLLCNMVNSLQAQQLTPQSAGSFGRSSANGNILLEDHIGSIAVGSFGTSTFMYTEGFLQPDAGVAMGTVYINNVTLSSGSGLDNAGTTFINGNIMLEFTTGEFASITLNGGINLLTQGILQPYGIGSTLPVTGLEFYAKRLNNTQVQLDWKTTQEINNKGFHIERKKENEGTFNPIDFVNTKAGMGGNSSFPLDYRKLDNNNFTGTTYYRIRQEDIDGRTSYSVVRIVKGDSKQLNMQLWPVPAVGFFNVNVSGLTKNDVLQVLDMNGRLVKQFTIQNNTQQQVNGLPAGTYYVKLAGDNATGQKVMVQ
ncbi:MAG: T9SS type A sorting domain-containing protein [Ferruginibacter sp.]|nr:T9SS type A sorting domain-containing protein [Ferruginibacter sp.]